MQIDFSPETAEMMYWRDFEALYPTGIIAEWETPNNDGYSEHWVTRIVFEDNPSWAAVDHRQDPVIEFYSIGRFGQFVSAYFVNTLLEGYGYGLALDAGVHSWTMNTDHIDEIRSWAENECVNAGYVI